VKDELFIDICRRQYGACFDMLRDLIERCPEEVWNKQEEGVPFWQQVYHTLTAVDFYLSESPDASRKWISDDGQADELDKASSVVLSREKMIEYLDFVAKKFEEFVKDLEAGGLDASNPFPWAGPTVAHRMFYNLRHAQHHLGWMASMLRRNGVEPADWICSR
jgi:hypothetical protein